MPTTSAIAGGASLPLELPDLAAAGLSARVQTPAGSPAARAGAAARTAAIPGAAIATAASAAATRKASASTKASTAKKATTASKAGYATTKVPAEFAFLKDPKLSIEEKLSRFIGLMMTKSEQDLLAQMEKMAPGSTSAAGGTGAAKPPAPAKKSGGIWGLAKALIPPLGLATSVLGDAKVKALVTQVSGPVLAAAATAIGLPELAPLALKLGPTVAGLVTSDGSTSAQASAPPKAAALAAGAGGATAGASGAAKPAAASATTGATTSKAAAAGGSTSEKAQLMELQRLQDRDNEMYTLFSNMLKAMHDARMTAIQNLR
jgi:hypothetical protein